jgi:hypothetical protein
MGTTMTADGRQPHTLVAQLRPDGHVAISGDDPDPDATWKILGCTPHEGCFVRAEVAGPSWTARIERTWLKQQPRDVVVTLERQSDPRQAPLLGWILFC